VATLGNTRKEKRGEAKKPMRACGENKTHKRKTNWFSIAAAACEVRAALELDCL
jgi:hypothetical protein